MIGAELGCFVRTFHILQDAPQQTKLPICMYWKVTGNQDSLSLIAVSLAYCAELRAGVVFFNYLKKRQERTECAHNTVWLYNQYIDVSTN